MTWEYLLTNKLDERCVYIAKHINKYVPDSIILDIDCMHAPLLKYIPNTFKKYIGNDILDMFPTCKNCKFLQVEDKYLLGELKSITDKIDIIIAIGVGGHEISNERCESSTLTNTIIETVLKYKPKILVLETVTKYKPILENILKEVPYEITKQNNLILGTDWVEDRIIYICRH